ncbi:MAG: site-2 protease family protein [Planctomycetaceae bacterium]|jgi:stage IV sporulation protein FB|nr:site-2 protease family protein [Planctomycetaceae bacterium]MDG2391264.1 site-2 protease family protein [Planctomycetaceae bacterium]
MFGQVPQTQYDLHFQVLGIPVRIHPAFFVLCVIMGFSEGWARELQVNVLVPILLWTGVVFVSILVHELGHALMARNFGWPPNITLYHFGGLASFQPSYGYTPTRSVLISLAGPGAGFILYGVVIAVEYLMAQQGIQQTPMMFYIFFQMKFVNLWWGLVNLLPVYPLDGGQVAQQICQRLDPYRGLANTFKLGIIVGVGVAIVAWQKTNDTYVALMFLFLAFNNYQMLEQTSGRRGPW